MLPRHFLIGLCVLLVGAAALLLVLLFRLEENEVENRPELRYEVYAHLDKLCKDVNALDKIQIAIYFLMQSWLNMCDSAPNTLAFAVLKFMKKRIHDAVTKKIHEFHEQEEQSVEDCIIEFYKTEIKPSTDDFHQMLFELTLSGYVKTFGGELDETGKLLKMETMNCNSTACQYTFPKPPSSPKIIEEIITKTNDIKEEVREKKCIQVFQYIYVWNEKIKKPEVFEWAYYLLFKGLESSLNVTEIEIKQNLHCGSSRMQEMTKALTSKPDDVGPSLVLFLRERDVEIEILEDEIEYTSASESKVLERRLTSEELLAELILKTYITFFDITPTDGKIIVYNGPNPRVEVGVPSMEHIYKL